MATIHGFYLAPEAWKEPFLPEGGEVHHLLRVLRLKAGARILVFDGLGHWGHFAITSAGRGSATLELLDEGIEAPPATRCTLATGFSKALHRGWFMENTVGLKASAVWFWQGEYSQASLPDAEKSKWKAALISGAKQCEATRLSELAMVQGGVHGIVERRGEFDRAFMLYEGDTGGRLLQRDDLAFHGSLLLDVVPEGGFSPDEAAVLSGAGILPVSLSGRILRWETAAVLTLGIAWWARQDL